MSTCMRIKMTDTFIVKVLRVSIKHCMRFYQMLCNIIKFANFPPRSSKKIYIFSLPIPLSLLCHSSLLLLYLEGILSYFPPFPKFIGLL